MMDEPSTWSEEVCKMLSERKLETRKDEKSTPMTQNVTLIEESVRCVKMKVFKKEIVDQINHVRLHKKVHFPLELVGARGRSRTDSFHKKNSKRQFKWKFKFPKVK